MGYKAAVVISHWSTGRVGIPLDRAVEIAGVVGLPPEQFYLSVAEQRHPGARSILSKAFAQKGADGLSHELEMLAGVSLDQLDQRHKQVLREAAREQDPGRRWLSLAEMQAVTLIRELRPNFAQEGLQPDDLTAIARALKRK